MLAGDAFTDDHNIALDRAADGEGILCQVMFLSTGVGQVGSGSGYIHGGFFVSVSLIIHAGCN